MLCKCIKSCCLINKRYKTSRVERIISDSNKYKKDKKEYAKI